MRFDPIFFGHLENRVPLIFPPFFIIIECAFTYPVNPRRSQVNKGFRVPHLDSVDAPTNSISSFEHFNIEKADML